MAATCRCSDMWHIDLKICQVNVRIIATGCRCSMALLPVILRCWGLAATPSRARGLALLDQSLVRCLVIDL